MNKLTFYVFHEGDYSVGIPDAEDTVEIILPDELYIVEEDIVEEFKNAVKNSFPDAVAVLTEREYRIYRLDMKISDLDQYLLYLEDKLDETEREVEKKAIAEQMAKSRAKINRMIAEIERLKKEHDIVPVT